MSRLSFRLAGPTDRAFVRALSVKAFARYGDYGEWLPGLVGLPDHETILARVADEPVGFAVVTLEPGPPGLAELQAIAVEARWRGRGVGRRLLHRSEALVRLALRGRGPVRYSLTVAAENTAARALFSASGFRPVAGSEGRYPRGQRSLDLAKIVGAKGPRR